MLFAPIATQSAVRAVLLPLLGVRPLTGWMALQRVQGRAESVPRRPRELLPPISSQDDIIDDVESFVAAAEILKERGAYKIYVMATHGILSAEAPRLIEESSIDEVCLSAGLEHLV